MSLRASKPKGLKWDRQNQLWLEVPERYRPVHESEAGDIQ
jgi:hypothetical protein